jgi:membrane fusion protein, macrolide-specific efflux system
MKKIIGLVVIAALGWAVYHYGFKPKKPVVNYRDVTVTKDSLQSTVLSTGIVQPENRLEIKPPVSGRIDKVLVIEGQPLKKNQVLAYMSSTERALLLDTARVKGRKAEAHWAALYKPIPIVAPLDGMLIKKKIEPGQTVFTGDTLLVMSDHLIVSAQVDETDLGRIQVGQEAVITLDSYPGQSVQAKVERIAFESQTVNNVTVYYVDILPQQVPSFMRSGMTANANFIIAKKKDVLVLPFESIRREDGKAFVLVAAPLNAKEPMKKEIITGITDGQKVEVVEGLAEGDTVKMAEGSIGGGPNPVPPWNRKTAK